MAYYDVCPDCGANLDPGEKCDCQEEKKKEQEFFRQHIKMEPKVGQFAFVFSRKEEGSYGKESSY